MEASAPARIAATAPAHHSARSVSAQHAPGRASRATRGLDHRASAQAGARVIITGCHPRRGRHSPINAMRASFSMASGRPSSAVPRRANRFHRVRNLPYSARMRPITCPRLGNATCARAIADVSFKSSSNCSHAALSTGNAGPDPASIGRLAGGRNTRLGPRRFSTACHPDHRPGRS